MSRNAKKRRVVKQEPVEEPSSTPERDAQSEEEKRENKRHHGETASHAIEEHSASAHGDGEDDARSHSEDAGNDKDDVTGPSVLRSSGRHGAVAAAPDKREDSQPVRNPQRLVIRDIDVENFKSYYGRHRIGPFHKTFTAVIGPNGSGKSNVIDSMLFVFGRNAKKIRLEKLSELIHNSAAHPDLTYASVTVNFVRVEEVTTEDVKCPEQRVEVPGSELSIKREVYRSGVSQYFIDGTRRTQKEVVERLIHEGVDLEHNRFLILQGEVEQIALMKPKAEKDGEEGLLEYLDDLIGTNEYLGRISAATKIAEEAQLTRLESLDKERKLLAEREALDDAKNSTLAFVTKDNHLQKTLIVMCQLRMRNIDERLVEPRRLLGEIDTRISGYEEDVQLRREAKAKAEEHAAQTKKEMAEITKERDVVRGKRQTVESQLEKLKSGASEEERARKKVVDHQKRAREEMQKAVLLQQDAERAAAIHQQNYEEATADVATLQAKFDTMSEELLPKLRPLRQQLDEKRKTFAPYERAVAEAEESVNTAKGRLDGVEEKLTKKVEQAQSLERAMDTRRARVAEIAEMLSKAEDNAEHHEKARKLMDAVSAAAQRKYAVNSSIQEMKISFREGEADDRAMEFLLSQRALKGYYGTLRQLGRIDDAYDIAAGVASNAWGFHVVEDRATAAAALELLKKNNIGRATMMVVSEIEKEMGERMRKPFTPPNPKARRIFDLIKPTNDKFKGVFYQAVRDTLVVSSLTEARETAFGSGNGERHRVVTLKGELVEPTGTITGGGASPRGAKLKAARSPQDKQAIKEELQRLQQELIQAAEEERAAQHALHALQEKEVRLSPEQARKLRTEHSKLSVAIDSEQQQCAILREEISSMQRDMTERREGLIAEQHKCEAALETAKRTCEERRHDMDALETSIEEAGGASFKGVTDGLKAAQDRAEAEDASLRGCRRNAQKSRAVQERKAKDLEEYAATLIRMEAEAAEGVKEQIAECTASIEELTRQLNGVEARLAQAQDAQDEARSAVPLANSAAVEAQKKLDDEQRYRQTEQAKIADALQELAKFEQKIEACEEKIKENAELYGVETLQLEPKASEEGEEDDGEEGSEEMQGHSSSSSSCDSDAEEEEEQGKAGEDGQQKKKRGHTAGRKRPRGSGGSGKGRGSIATSMGNNTIRSMSFRLSTEELERCDYDRSVHLAKALSEETKRLHSEIDFRAVALWRERDLAHRQAKARYLECKEVSDTVEKELGALKEKRRAAFMRVFESIRRKLKEVYQLLTHGGDADMELVDVNDPFEGVNFVVRPPKKSWKQISNLSGGEKTLSSLALIFSLHHIKPTPIYVMDEIDAALDFRNVSIVANYVLRQATGAQFIIISLRNNMFEMAHQLVGVCKVNDVTSTLVLHPRNFQKTVERLVLGTIKESNRLAPGTGSGRASRASGVLPPTKDSSSSSSPIAAVGGSDEVHHRGSAVSYSGQDEGGAGGERDHSSLVNTPSSCGVRLSTEEGGQPPRKSVRFSEQVEMVTEKENEAPY